MPVTCVTLYQSRLSPEGPTHTPLVRAAAHGGGLIVSPIADRRRRVSHRVDAVRAAPGAAVGRGRSPPGRERQSRRGQRAARVGRQGRRAGGAARRREGRGERAGRRASDRQRRRAAVAGFAAIVGHIYPVWLRIPRRQGRGHGLRRVLGADAARRCRPRRRDLRRRPSGSRKYVSLGSVVASVALPPLAYAMGTPAPAVVAAFAAAAAHRLPAPRRTWRGCAPAPSGGLERAPDADDCRARRGQLGHGARRAPRPRRARRAPVGARFARWSPT